MMGYLQSYLIILIEMCCFILFYDMVSVSEKRFGKGGIFLWTIVSAFVLFGINYLFDRYFLVKEIFNILCISFGALILKKTKLRNAFLVSILFVFLLVMSDFITIAIYTRILSVDRSDADLFHMLVVLMSKSVLLLLILLCRKLSYLCRGEEYEEKDHSDMRFAIFPSISICMIAVLLSNQFGIHGERENNLIWCMIFSLTAMNVLVFFYVKDMTEKHLLLWEKRMFEMEAKSQQALYQTLEEKIDAQRRISHDYKNHLYYIQALLERKEYDGVSEYLRKIVGEVAHDLDRIDTNHPVMNTMINTKFYEAKNAGAIIICKVDDLSEIQIEEVDLILLISNLFNNAIEAIKQCREKKILRFKLVNEQDKFIISVQNSYEGVLKRNREGYLTTKKEKGEVHGLGIKNVMRITEKYQGMYLFDHTEDEFHATIIIPHKNEI